MVLTTTQYEIKTMDIYDHLDNLNDLILDNPQHAEHELKRYCELNDLDPDGFEIIRENGLILVDVK